MPPLAGKREATGGRARKKVKTEHEYAMVSGPPKGGPRGFLPLQRGVGIRGETKAVDLLPAAYVLNTTGTVTGINLIRIGSSFNNRIGRKICMKSLYVNGSFQPAAAAVGQTYARLVVVYDAQTNGTLPTWANVFTSYDQALTTSSLVTDGVNLDYRDRFKIIMDHRMTLPELTASSVANPDQTVNPTGSEIMVQEFRVLGNLETQFKFDSSPAVIGDIATGSLIFLTLGDVAPGSEWQFKGTIRLRFTDN